MAPARRFIGLLTGVAFGVGGVLAARWLRGSLDVVVVEGRSMEPALHPGDWLLAESLTYRRRRPRDGEVVLARDPREPRRELIKRARLDPGGGYRLLGDREAASTDSREFGSVPAEEILWRAILRYWPPGRIGLVKETPARGPRPPAAR